MSATDWSTVATLATAVGTLVLAVATFAAVRSANRAARVAEAAYQANLRPVLVPSRIQDPAQKVRWMDDHWAHLEGGQASAELVDGSVYLAISVRNVGAGIAVPFGWCSATARRQVTCRTRNPSSSGSTCVTCGSHHPTMGSGRPRFVTRRIRTTGG